MQTFLSILRRLTAVREPIPSRWSKAFTVFALLALVVGYTMLSAHQHQINPNDQSIPSWSQIWNDGIVKSVELQKRTGVRWLVEDVYSDAGRFGLGLGIGVVSAVFIGLNMGAFSAVESVIGLPIAFFSRVPPAAAFGAFFILVKDQENMLVAVVVFAVLPTLAQSIAMTAKEFPPELRYKALTLGAGSFDLVWWIMFRWALPRIIDSVRLQVGEVVKALIGAELLVGNTGFGSQIRAQMRNSNMAMVFTYVVIIVGVCWAIDNVLVVLKLYTSPQLSKQDNGWGVDLVSKVVAYYHRLASKVVSYCHRLQLRKGSPE